MNKILSFILLCLSSSAFSAPNAESLLNQKSCDNCHQQTVPSVPNKVFARDDRKVKTLDELTNAIKGGAPHTLDVRLSMKNNALTPQEREVIGAYLNRRFYHF